MVTVVSGLPRSGTSMMMGMIRAGGMKLLTDNVRAADPDNSEGYYEYERVKKLPDDVVWLDEAEGQAVKVISSFLKDLPSGRQYKVIFMMRNMQEVLASQAAMLKRRGHPTGPSSIAMKKHFDSHLRKVFQWIEKQPTFEVLYSSYGDAIKNPRGCAEKVRDFLGVNLDVEAMIRVVNPALHRQKCA